jgi:predicted extracellular nuclease
MVAFISTDPHNRLSLEIHGLLPSTNNGLCSISASQVGNCLEEINQEFGQAATYSFVKRESRDEIANRRRVGFLILTKHFLLLFLFRGLERFWLQTARK